MRAIKKYRLSRFNFRASVCSQGYATNGKKDESQGCVRRSATGLLLGIYSKNDGRHDTANLTKPAAKYDKKTCGKLWELLRSAGPCPALGETRIFYGLEPQFTAVGVVGLGEHCTGYNEGEGTDLSKENIRHAAGAGVRAMEPLHLNRLHLECKYLWRVPTATRKAEKFRKIYLIRKYSV